MAGSRDRVTIDLRGIGEAVRSAASTRGLGVAQLVRRAIVESLALDQPIAAVVRGWPASRATMAKLTLRLPQREAEALVLNAGALGMSYGEYVAKLVSGSRLPQPIAERAADRAALLAACDQLAALSTDLNAFVRLLGAGKHAELEPYRERIRTVDAEARRQLDRMAKFLDAL